MLTRNEAKSLEKYLQWFNGFEETSLYQDYINEGIFTEHEYSETRIVLNDLVNRHMKAREKENVSCP